ncbi:MAG: nucleotidyltransferase domain-containing protein [Spirochaetales bacterium]|nr:nucleotidyltransferase domain-containing protein [Spirochaetales bacterium]
MNIDIEYEEKYYTILKDMVLAAFANINCRVFLFGSRANGTYSWGSDFDIGIEGVPEDLCIRLKYYLLDQIEESIIPWNVDIINFDTVNSSFKQTALKEFIPWISA